jgi:integrase
MNMSMAVQQRPDDGRWRIDFRFNDQRIRRNSPENSKKGAMAYEALLRSRLARGLPITPEEEKNSTMTFREFGNYWHKTSVMVNNKPTTARAKRTHMDLHLFPMIGSKPLDEISRSDIERIKTTKINQGLSPKTVNNILSTLSVALNEALEQDHIDKVPKIRWLKQADQSFDFLNEDECEALIRGTSDIVLRDMVLCAMRTGMRRGELLALEWSNVDFKRNQITVEKSYVEGHMNSTKNNRIRYIPMTLDLHSTLSSRKKLKGFVFSHKGLVPERGIMANKWLYKLCDDVGMRRIGWHIMRHTFASHLVMKGIPMRAVQMLLGHSTIQMTERYAHLSPSTLQDAVAVLNMVEMESMGDFGIEVGSRNIAVPALEAYDEYEVR